MWVIRVLNRYPPYVVNHFDGTVRRFESKEEAKRFAELSFSTGAPKPWYKWELWTWDSARHSEIYL